MPSFEFPIPNEFLFIVLNLSFLSFTFIISLVISKLFKSFTAFILVFITVFSFAYYDLMLHFAIKKYYEFSQMTPKINFYPIKDNEGKIESLSTVDISSYDIGFKEDLSFNEESIISQTHEKYIKEFIDIKIDGQTLNGAYSKEKRVYLNIYKYDNSFIENKNKKAKYAILYDGSKSYFDLFSKNEYKFVDTSTNLIMAKAYFLEFKDKNSFRLNYLYWNSSENFLKISSVENYDLTYRLLFLSD